MRLSFACVLLLTAANLNAQQNVKAYLSEADFAAGSGTTLANVAIRKCQLTYSRGEYVYRVSSVDKKINKQLLTKCWAVERNDSLFLNSNKVFKTKETNKRLPADRKVRFDKDVYALVLFRSPNYLHFRAGRTNTYGIPPPFRDDIGDAGLSGLLGATVMAGASAVNSVMAASDDQLRFHYLYEIKKGKVIYFNRGVMRNYVKQLSAPQDAEFVSYVNKLIASEK